MRLCVRLCAIAATASAVVVVVSVVVVIVVVASQTCCCLPQSVYIALNKRTNTCVQQSREEKKKL